MSNLNSSLATYLANDAEDKSIEFKLKTSITALKSLLEFKNDEAIKAIVDKTLLSDFLTKAARAVNSKYYTFATDVRDIVKAYAGSGNKKATDGIEENNNYKIPLLDLTDDLLAQIFKDVLLSNKTLVKTSQEIEMPTLFCASNFFEYLEVLNYQIKEIGQLAAVLDLD